MQTGLYDRERPVSPRGERAARLIEAGKALGSPRTMSPRASTPPRGASPFVKHGRSGTNPRPPLPSSGGAASGGKPQAMRLGQPRAVASPAAAAPAAAASSAAAAAAPAYAGRSSVHRSSASQLEGATMEQARAVVRMLESQVEEARADKSAIWEQTRADARAMAQVAKNIEGNQGVLAGVVTTLEAQLEAAHKEKDGAMEALRNERKLVERLTREHERQLRDAERQRDRAQAAADEAAKGRKTAQEALDAARRAESDANRERNAMAREVKAARDGGGDGGGGGSGTAADNERVAAAIAELRAELAGGELQSTLLRDAQRARDEAEARLEALRGGLGAQLRTAVEEKEGLLAELAAARSGESPALVTLRAELAVAQREAAHHVELARGARAEAAAAAAGKEELLVQARLAEAAQTSREREHSQALLQKDSQVNALERELAAMAGQLVAAQAEAKTLAAGRQSAEEAALRERTSLLQAQTGLEAEKAEVASMLRAAEAHKAELMEQLSQHAGDRDFCYDVIRELRAQLAHYAGGQPGAPAPATGTLMEVRL